MILSKTIFRSTALAALLGLGSVLRGAPETNGAILHANGSVQHAAQGQTTLFRLRPGALFPLRGRPLCCRSPLLCRAKLRSRELFRL